MSLSPEFELIIHMRNGERISIPQAEKVFIANGVHNSVQGISNRIFNGNRISLELPGGGGLILVPAEISYIEVFSVR